LAPVAILKVSIDKWGEPPAPELAYESRLGCAFDKATRSCGVLTGSVGVTTIAKGNSAIKLMGVNEVSGL
jgi:hypothetical protein